MAVLCSIITKEVRDSYESFMKNEGITNRNNFNIAIYNSIMTSLLVANENMLQQDITDQMISDEYNRRSNGFAKVIFTSDDVDEEYKGSGKTVEHFKFGKTGQKIDGSHSVIGLTSDNGEKATDAMLSPTKISAELGALSDKMESAFDFQYHLVNGLYSLMFAIHCNNMIQGSQSEEKKKEYGKYFSEKREMVNTEEALRKEVKSDENFNLIAQMALKAIFERKQRGVVAKHYMWMLEDNNRNNFSDAMKKNVAAALDKYKSDNSDLFTIEKVEDNNNGEKETLLQKKINSIVDYAKFNPNTIISIDSLITSNEVFEGTKISPNKILAAFVVALKGKLINMPENILFPRSWEDSGFLVAKQIDENAYDDMYGKDKQMSNESEQNAIAKFNLSTTVQQKDEIIGLQKLIMKHLLYYVAKRNNMSALTAFRNPAVKTEIRKAINDMFNGKNDKLDEILAIIQKNKVESRNIIKQHENNGQQIASEDELRSVFDENGRFTIYKGMSSRSIFCRNALMKSIDKRKNKDLDLVMVNEMMQKISDNLGVVYRLALRELGADLSLKNNFQSERESENDDSEDEEPKKEEDSEDGTQTNDSTKDGDDDMQKAAQNNNDGFGDNFTNDPRLSMSKEIRYILSNLIDIDINDDSHVEARRSNVFGFTKTIDYAFAYNLLMETLVPMHSSNDMINILEYEKDMYPWISQLLEIFKQKPEIKTAFYCTFAKSYNQFVVFNSKNNKGTSTYSNKDRFIFKNNPTGIYNLLDKWRHTYEDRNILSPEFSIYDYDKNKELVINTENAKKLEGLVESFIYLKKIIEDHVKNKPEDALTMKDKSLVASVYSSILSGDVYDMIKRRDEIEKYDKKPDPNVKKPTPLDNHEIYVLNIFNSIKNDIDKGNLDDLTVEIKDAKSNKIIKDSILNDILEKERLMLGAVAININKDILKRVMGHYGLVYIKGSKNREWVAQAEDIFNSILSISSFCGKSNADDTIESYDDYETGSVINKDLISTFGSYYRQLASTISKINNNTALLSSVNIDGKSYYAHNMETNISEVIKILKNTMAKYSFNGEKSTEALREYNREVNELFRQYEWYFTPDREANGSIKYDAETGAMKGTWKVDWLEMLDAENVTGSENEINGKLKKIYEFQKKLNSFVLVKADEKEYSAFSKPYHMKVLMKAFERFGNESNYATYSFFTLSDLGTEIYIDGLKYNMTNFGKPSKLCIQKFNRVAKQELDRMIKVRNMVAANYKLPDTYREEGTHFCFLRGLRGVDNEIENQLLAEYTNGSAEFEDDLNYYIEKYLEEKKGEAFDEFVEIGMFDKNEKGEFEFLNTSEVKSPDDKIQDFKNAEKALKDLANKVRSSEFSLETNSAFIKLERLMQIGQRSFEKGNRELIRHAKIKELVDEINSLNELDSSDKLDINKFDIDANYMGNTCGMYNFVLNADYARTQMANIFCTDLAYYGGCMNFSKRVKGYQSPYNKMDIHARYRNGKGQIESVGRKYEKVLIMKEVKERSELLTKKDEKGLNYIQRIFMQKELGSWVDRINNDKTLTEEQKKEYIDKAKKTMDSIASMFGKMKVTDAAAYRTLESYRDIMIMMDNENWTKEAEAAYQNIISGNYTMKDFQVLLRQFKPFFNAPITITIGGVKQKVPFQIKNSEQALMAIFNTINEKYSQKYKNLNKYMHERGIDSAVYESCVKVGFVNENEIDLESIGNLDYDDFEKKMDKLTGMKDNGGNDIHERYTFDDAAVYNVDLERFGDQTFTDDHLTDRKQSEGTQQKKLVFMDIPGDANFFIPGYENNGSPKAMKKEELLRLYNKLLSTKLMNALSKCDKTIGSVRALSEKMKSIIKTDTSWNIEDLNCFDVIRNEETGKDEFRLSILDPIQAKRIFAMVSSIIKKDVLIYTDGGTVLNECCIALSDEEQPHIIMKKDENGNDFIDAIECWLPASSKAIFEQFITKDKDGNDVINLDPTKIPDEIKELVGYRIPSEDKYSVLPLRIKGFLNPSEGNSILLPKEITTLSGLDFDGDKFFLMIYGFKRNEDGTIEKAKYDYNKQPWEQSDVAVGNAIIDLTRAVLRHESSAQKIFNPGNFDEEKSTAREVTIFKNFKEWWSDIQANPLLISRDDEISNSIIKNIRKVLESTKIDEEQKLLNVSKIIRYEIDQNHLNKSTERFLAKFESTSVLSQVEMSSQNTMGKSMVGIFALGNSFHAVLEETKLALKKEKSYKMCGHTGKAFNRMFDFEGKYISKTLAENIGAGADTAKDACLNELGANLITGNLYVMLEQQGFSTEEIAIFFNQPIISKIINYLLRSNYADTDSSAIRALNQFVNENIDTALDGINIDKSDEKAVAAATESIKAAWKEVLFGYTKVQKDKDGHQHSLNDEDVSKALMINNLVKRFDEYDSKSDMINQVKIASMFVYLMDLASGFQKFVSVMRTDTTKGSSGPTIGNCLKKIIAIQKFKESKYYKMFENEGTDREINEELDKLLKSFNIVRDSKGKINIAQTMLANSVGNSNNDNLVMSRTVGLTPITNSIGFKVFFTQDFMQTLNLIEDCLKKNESDLNETTLNRIVNDFITYWQSKSRIFTTKSNFVETFVEQYIQFKETHNDLFQKYLILQRLQYVKKSKQYNFPIISFHNAGELTKEEQQKMTKELSEMFESDDSDVRAFARSMFIYSYVKDSLGFSRTSYAQLFPSNVRLQLSDYKSNINELENRFSLSDDEKIEFAEQYVLNHLRDDKSQFVSNVYKDGIVKQFQEESKDDKFKFQDSNKTEHKLIVPKKEVTVGLVKDEVIDSDIKGAFLKNIVYDESGVAHYNYKTFIAIKVNGHTFFYKNSTKSTITETPTYTLVSPLGLSKGSFKEYKFGANEGFKSNLVDNDNDKILDTMLQEAKEKAEWDLKKKGKKDENRKPIQYAETEESLNERVNAELAEKKIKSNNAKANDNTDAAIANNDLAADDKASSNDKYNNSESSESALEANAMRLSLDASVTTENASSFVDRIYDEIASQDGVIIERNRLTAGDKDIFSKDQLFAAVNRKIESTTNIVNERELAESIFKGVMQRSGIEISIESLKNKKETDDEGNKPCK